MKLNSSTRRAQFRDRCEAHDVLLMIAGLPYTQAVDVIQWALAGRTHRAATGIPAYSPTMPSELSDEYIAAQYAYFDGQLDKLLDQQRTN